MIPGIGRLLLAAASGLAWLTPACLKAAPLPPSTPPAATARYDRSALLIKLKPGYRFMPGLPRTGSAPLDARLARASALEAAHLFSTPRAGRPPRADLGVDRVYRVRLQSASDIPALVAELSRDSGVEWAEPDYEGSAAETPSSGSVVPNDPYFDHQWALRNTGQVPGVGPSTPGADIRAMEGWAVTTGDSSVIVAVLDSGIRYEYPDFAGRVWMNRGEIPGNGIDDDGNGYVDDVRGYNFANANADVRDDLGHGNAVSGVIGVTSNDGLGYCGLDWACRIMPVKILNGEGNGLYSWWISGIDYAVSHGARILNMSLVGGHASLALETAVRYAYAQGCLLVAAMGNSGDSTRYVPASYDTEVLAVGATDRNDRRAGFSTFGNHLDVVAPGQDIAVLTLGTETYSSYGSGTSFASPMAAGLAALLLAKNPSLSAGELRDIIDATADDGVGRDAEDASGWDPKYGYGRIDCLRALTLDAIPHAPTVAAPAFLNPTEGQTTTIAVSVSDPDGDPIRKLEADTSALPRGNDASFVTNAGMTSGTLSWTPTYEDAGGPYTVAFRAYDPLRGQATTTMYVGNVNRLPAVIAPETAAFMETEVGGFDVRGADPDGEELILEASGVPLGATFEDRADNTGAFTWTPAPGQAGTYTVRFTARDGWNGIGSANTRLDVRRINRSPVAEAGGPYAGVAGAPVAFDGTGSSDPDGDPLRYSWSFGDGAEAAGAAPSHAYDRGGDYRVVLEASDGALAGRDSTSARIADTLPARAFLVDGRRSISLSGGSAPVGIGLEPVSGSYRNADLDLASLALVADGAGTAAGVPPEARAIAEGDRDRDGVAELLLRFDRLSLRQLFAGVTGRDSVAAAVEGRLRSGARVRAPLALVVVGTGRAIGVSSNPIAAGATITLRSGHPGRLRVRLFDARGRLVRTLVDEAAAAPGYHEVAFEARSTSGDRLPSGVYFLRAETADGVATSRVAVLK